MDNEPIDTNERTYSSPYEEGMLIIAYPDTEVEDTEFDFEYWVGPFKESWIDRLYYFDFRGAYGKKLMVIFACGSFLSLCILLGITKCICNNMAY